MPSTKTPDFLKNLKEGNEEALNTFVASELPRVFNLALRLCRDHAEAEDLTQDVFARAVRSLVNFRGEAQLSTWLYAITVNMWKNKVRSETRRFRSAHVPLVLREVDGEEEKVLELRDPSHGPDHVAEINEITGTVFLALDRLDTEERAIIVLRDIEDRSYQEISNIFQWPMGTVKSKLARARETLRHILGTMGHYA